MLVSKIKTFYEKHDQLRLCQGDIFRDLKFATVRENAVVSIFLPYVVIISQDCDLEQGQKIENFQNDEVKEFSQFLPNILCLPAFPETYVKDGTHLIDIYKIKPKKIDKDIWRRIKPNKDERYHYLPSNKDYQIPDLVIDFKIYFTIQTEDFLKLPPSSYLGTINELFREHLSQRFSNYLNRIATPEIAVVGEAEKPVIDETNKPVAGEAEKLSTIIE